MNCLNVLGRPLGACVLVVAALFVPRIAQAQDVPSYARQSDASADEMIHGRIRSVDGAFTISIDDDRGFVDEVQLHGGTIINPTGLTLSPGMSVTILGYNAGSSFDANEIDTPYSYDGPLPTPVYYGAGYWCPGFAYGYGPSFGLAIVFGGGDRPWHYEHRAYYGRPWNGSGYFGSAVSFAPDGRRRIEAEHAPAAFAGRSFAGAERFSSESNAAAARQSAGFSGRDGAGARAFNQSDGVRAANARDAAPPAARSYGAAETGRDYRGNGARTGGMRQTEASRGATAHAQGGRSDGGHGDGGHSGGGRGDGGARAH